MEIAALKAELSFKTSRSSGKGGQHVNKVSTRVELNFNVALSSFLNAYEKEIIQEKLSNRISNEGNLQLTCQETRSQFRNKELVIQRFFELLEVALTPVKKRKVSRPSKKGKEARLQKKRHVAQKKQARKKVSSSDTDLFSC